MDYHNLVRAIGAIHSGARAAAARSVDHLLTIRNWLMGASIIQYEQDGEDRSVYGAELLPKPARSLAEEGYRGLGLSNLKNCRQLALSWPNFKVPPVVAEQLRISFTEKAIRQSVTGELAVGQTIFQRHGGTAGTIKMSIGCFSALRIKGLRP